MTIARLAFLSEMLCVCLLSFLCCFYYVFYLLWCNTCGVCGMGSGRLAISAMFGCSALSIYFGI
ncbi:hypothetical protein BGX38DRAFT_1185556 [Terfezia claveryi]|nr:hypothetical protein BGX38DRAFT_1185556 [Terfezia claveryi]